MNQNYVHTITLYNRIRAADSAERKEEWHRTVLYNCFWKSVVKTGFNGKEASVRNTYVTRIPHDSRYVPYHEFVKAPEGCFTVSMDDIVICGECLEEITGGNGSAAAQILNKYKPDAFRVTAFSDNTAFPIDKHYRLGG